MRKILFGIVGFTTLLASCGGDDRPRGIGDSCTSNGDCASGLCLEAGAAGATAQDGGRVCGAACTGTSGWEAQEQRECPIGSVCVQRTCRAGCQGECGTMVPVPPGTFRMGCAREAGCPATEAPAHDVAVPLFEIDRYEVTVAEYARCVAEKAADLQCSPPTATYGLCNWRSGREPHPMNCVTWAQARRYCEWAGKRLCTEAEWEKAARGTDGRMFPWGDQPPTCDRAIVDQDGEWGCGRETTWAVGSRRAGASPVGALDLSGNVWEWVEDWYYPTHEGAAADGSARTPPATPAEAPPPAPVRVAKGGSFATLDDGLHASGRTSRDAESSNVVLGFRCCRTPATP